MNACTINGRDGRDGTDSGYKLVSPYAQRKLSGDSLPSLPSLPFDAENLIDDCDSLGIELWAESGQIRYRGPRGAITPDLAGRLRAHKAEVLAILDPPRPAIFPDRWGPGLDDGVGSIVMPEDCWRWYVANLPLPEWKAWRRLADELTPDGANAAQIVEAQKLAYRRLATS